MMNDPQIRARHDDTTVHPQPAGADGRGMAAFPGPSARHDAGAAYTVLHGRRSLQLATNRLLIPADEVGSFVTAAHCAQALTSLLEHERSRVNAALKAAQEIGIEQGRKEGEQAVSAALAEAVARMAAELQAQQVAARESVSTLALAVVHKLAASLGASGVVPALIEQAVLELLPARATRVRVSPEALETTRAHLSRLGLDAEVRIDETLNPFDCVIESAHGQNVVSLDTQLAAIGKALGVKPEIDLEIA
jgi:flagellar biosynthesis/type III secretory pathway protein FliH